MSYDDFNLLADLVLMISIIAIWIVIFGYGEWRYREGVQDGQKQRRKLEREIRRGNIYRVK